MNKSRPEKIEIKTPTRYADRIEALLREVVPHPQAMIERTDDEGKTVISYWPTVGEYFKFSVAATVLCESIGLVKIDQVEDTPIEVVDTEKDL